jgi:hypothetical protein
MSSNYVGCEVDASLLLCQLHLEWLGGGDTIYVVGSWLVEQFWEKTLEYHENC